MKITMAKAMGSCFGVDDAVEMFQVDARPERLVAGFVDKIDRQTSVFIGIDRRDEPAAATETLLKEMSGHSMSQFGSISRPS